MFRTAQKSKWTGRTQPDFIDFNVMFEPADIAPFERRTYRMRPRLNARTGTGDETTRFICVIDPRSTNVRRVSKQFEADGVKIAHCLEFIDTLVVLGNPVTVRNCAEQISGIKSLLLQRAGRTEW